MEEEHSLCMEKREREIGGQVPLGRKWSRIAMSTQTQNKRRVGFTLSHFYSFTLSHFQATYITLSHFQTLRCGQPPPSPLLLSPFGSKLFSALPNSVCPRCACRFSFMVTSVCMACFSSQPWWWCWWRGHTLMSVHSTQLSYTCIHLHTQIQIRIQTHANVCALNTRSNTCHILALYTLFYTQNGKKSLVTRR